jgi:alpha-ketoglutarate-dependent 2,4-dichlorophenoxyacetate dioxygenase
MTIKTRELHPGFAAEIPGLNLSEQSDDGVIADIRTTVDAYPVLIFRDQHLTDAQLRDFRALDDRRRLDSLGNRLWHTDASYMPVPVVLGLLHAVTLPPPSPLGNGETEFADMRAAYDALPLATRHVVDPLVAEHDVFWSRAQIGFTEFPPGEREQYPPSRQRLVRRHPVTGRRSLYLSAHASHIVGWPVADGRLLLLDLNTHATQRKFIYSHTWRRGDLVIWDNRWTMHRGRPHDENQPRDLRRATTLDTESTFAEEAAA